MNAPSSHYPQIGRLILGFLLAPLLPSFLYSVLSGGPQFLLLVAPPAYASAVVLGVPAYFALRSCVRPTAWATTLAGGFVAAAPWLVLLSLASVLWAPHYSEFNGRVSYRNGQLTWEGLLSNVQFIGTIFAFGMIGGLVFWLCVAWRSPLRQEQRA